MYPSQHMLGGIIVSAIIYVLFPQIGVLGALIILIASFGIDADHYLFYLWRKHDFNLSNAYDYFLKRPEAIKKQGKRYCPPLYAFHTAEFFVLVIAASFFTIYAFYVLIGMIAHIFLDDYQIFIINKTPQEKVFSTYSYFKKGGYKEP